MSLPGQGFLAIWNDVAAEHEADWLNWHNREHIPERVGVPGFLGGRRYADPALDHHRLFTLYIGETVATFSSPPYLERLNNPTPWTTRLAPHFRNFLRGACRTVTSVGMGTGGAVMTIRLGVGTPPDPNAASKFAADLIQSDGLVGAHLGVQDASISGVQTKEKALRGDKQSIDFEGVLIVEGTTRAALLRERPRITSAIAGSGLGLSPSTTGIYELSFSLDKGQL